MFVLYIDLIYVHIATTLIFRWFFILFRSRVLDVTPVLTH
jgi:hypothetical protein